MAGRTGLMLQHWKKMVTVVFCLVILIFFSAGLAPQSRVTLHLCGLLCWNQNEELTKGEDSAFYAFVATEDNCCEIIDLVSTV